MLAFVNSNNVCNETSHHVLADNPVVLVGYLEADADCQMLIHVHVIYECRQYVISFFYSKCNS